MAEAGAKALYADLHDAAPFHDGTFKSWHKTRSRTHPYHYSDGVTISVSGEDLSPDDDFLRRPAAWSDDDEPAQSNR